MELVMKINSSENQVQAFGYLRTSSAANVGQDKDSDKRQRQAIQDYARQAGITIKGWHYDAAVSGADRIEDREGFTAMLAAIAANGARTIIVETASRFARDLIVQETGFQKLKEMGITLIAADSPGSFQDSTPTAEFIRQVLGAVSQLEKAMLVAKLKGARDRKRATGVKVEGRKSYAEREGGEELIAAARALNDGRSLRQIAADLAEQGYLNSKGKPYQAKSVATLLGDMPLQSSHAGRRPSHGKRKLTPGAA
jgi:DNA invertase Pin-like site-specific DNA recombinase